MVLINIIKGAGMDMCGRAGFSRGQNIIYWTHIKGALAWKIEAVGHIITTFTNNFSPISIYRLLICPENIIISRYKQNLFGDSLDNLFKYCFIFHIDLRIE